MMVRSAQTRLTAGDMCAIGRQGMNREQWEEDELGWDAHGANNYRQGPQGCFRGNIKV